MKYIALIAFLLFPSALLAYGPGVHIREAERTLALLEEAQPGWAQPASDEMALSYLRLGSIAPDFQWASEELNFGHSKGLSYALHEAAQDMPPQYRLFALGHLAHILSDASSEVFFAPTIFASAPLGPFDLFKASDDAKAETEAICEGYGDFILGDWHAVIDILFDFHRDGEPADEAFAEIFLWYCEMGKAHHDKDTNCENALSQIQGLLSSADSFLGSLDREGSKTLVSSLIDQPLEGLFGLYTGGLLTSFIGGDYELSENFAYFEGLFLGSALVTEELWELYDEAFVNLGPRLTLDHLELEATGWPEYDGVSLKSGNIQSMLQFLPEDYAPMPFLRLNELTWLGPDGQNISSVDESHQGQKLSVYMVLHASMAYTGTITGVVRRDMPGFSQGEDDIVGTASIQVDIDPHDYSHTSRTELEISFSGDHGDALGYYVELSAEEGSLPWMTTHWDRIWTITALDLSQPIYRNHFGTYGHWPPSLPIADAEGGTASLFADVVVYPAGPGIEGVTAHLEPNGLEAITESNGLAHFDAVAPGNYQMTYTKKGYLSSQVEATATAHDITWMEGTLQPIPRPIPPSLSWGDPDCIPFTWNIHKFGGQTKTFHAQLKHGESDEELSDWEDVGNTGEGIVCASETLVHGTPLVIQIRAVYVDDLVGFEAPSDPFYLDTAGPAIYDVKVTQDAPPPCDEDFDSPFITAMEVSIRSQAVPPGIQHIRWRLSDESEWIEQEDYTLEAMDESDETWLSFSIETQDNPPSENLASLEVELSVTSGKASTTDPKDIKVANPDILCDSDAPEEEGSESDVEEVDEEDLSEESSSGGCSAHGNPFHGLPLLALFLFWMGSRRECFRD